ncbi:MAG: helix-turn-helix transcriptional regulator, partial [Opitutales bacterium]
FAHMHDSVESPLIFLPRPEPLVDAFAEMRHWTRRAQATAALIALGGSLARLVGMVIEGRRAMAGKARRIEERIRLSVERMHESLHAPLHLHQLAAEARLSVPHYCATFKKQIGTTPIQLHTQLRIRRACELLSQTRLAIREVGDEVGYDDPFYFSRTFRRVMGVSPSAYRKDHPAPLAPDEAIANDASALAN